MKPDFPQYLAELIAARYASRRDFIRAAQPNSNKSGANSYLSQVLSGQRPPPPSHLAGWADALGLRGEKRCDFLILAALSHLSDELKTPVIELHDEVVKLRKTLATKNH